MKTNTYESKKDRYFSDADRGRSILKRPLSKGVAMFIALLQILSGLVWPLILGRPNRLEAAGQGAATGSYMDPNSFSIYAAQLPMRGSTAEIQMFWNREKKTWFRSWSGAANIIGRPRGKYYMWCLDFGLKGMDEVDLPRRDWRSVLHNNEAVAAGLVYIATHGFPHKVPAGMPREKADAATQLAIWQYLEDMKMSPGGNSNHLYNTGQVKAFKNVVDPPADVQATAAQRKPGRYWVDELVAGAKRTKSFKKGGIRVEQISDWQPQTGGEVVCEVKPVGDFDDWAVSPKVGFRFDKVRGKPGEHLRIRVDAAHLSQLPASERTLEIKSYVDLSPANFGWYPSVQGPSGKVQSYMMVAEGSRFASGGTTLQLEPATQDLPFLKQDVMTLLGRADTKAKAKGTAGGAGVGTGQSAAPVWPVYFKPEAGFKGAVYALKYVGCVGGKAAGSKSGADRIFYQGKAFAPGDTILTAETDGEGKGVLRALPPGRYDLLESISPSGYSLNRTAVRFELTAAGVKALPTSPLPQTDNAEPLLAELNAAVDGLNKRAEEIGSSRRQAYFIRRTGEGKEKNSTGLLAPGLTTYERPAFGYVELHKKIEADPDGWNKNLKIPDEGITFAVKNKAGQLVDQIQTNREGRGISGLLPLGDYQLEELSHLPGLIPAAPLSFTLREDGAVQEFEILNKARKNKLKLVKVDRETGGRLPIAGISFRFYRTAEGGDPLKIADKDIFYTDENGELLLPKTFLGEGTYYIEEVKTPQGYYLASGAKRIPFTLSGGEGVEETVNLLVKEIDNIPQKGRLSLSKTGDLLKGWTLEQYDKQLKLLRTERIAEIPRIKAKETEPAVKGTKVQPEKTVPAELPPAKAPSEKTASGTIPTGTQSAPTTQQETKIPPGKSAVKPPSEAVLSESATGLSSPTSDQVPARPEADHSAAGEQNKSGPAGAAGEKSQAELVSRENASASSADTGAAPAAAADLVKQESEELGQQEKEAGVAYSLYRPIWEKGPLAGAEFAIIAESDIYSASNQSRESGKEGRILLHKSGDRVALLKTDVSGRALSPELPLGAYRLEEIKTPEGFVRSKPLSFELKAGDQTLRVRDEARLVHNKRQHFSIALTKNFERSEHFAYEQEAAAQTYFGLFTAEEVKYGESTIPAATLLDLAQPDSQGRLSFKTDFQGRYAVRELTTHKAYLPVADVAVETAFCPDQSALLPSKREEPLLNRLRRGSLELVKVDVEKGKSLAGARFRLTAVKGEQKKDLGLFVTDDKGRLLIEDLEFGNYYLTEAGAPAGYVRSKGLFHFMIDGIKRFQMKLANRENEVRFEKVDLVTGRLLPGADIELYDATGKLCYSGQTDERGSWQVRGLAPGLYTYLEKKAPDGYAVDTNRYTLTVDQDGLPDRETYKIENKKIPDSPGTEEPTRPERPLPRTGQGSGAPVRLGLFLLAGSLAALLLAGKNLSRKKN